MGNQFFQVAALLKFTPNSFYILVGMHDIVSCVDGFSLKANFLHISLSSFKKSEFFKRTLRWFFEFLAKCRFISSAEEIRKTSIECKITKGFLYFLVYFKTGYYQSSEVLGNFNLNKFPIKNTLLSDARKIINSISSDPSNLFFIHIRRGDYINWPSQTAPGVLPLRWYLDQINLICLSNPNAHFLIFSDDYPYAKEFFNSDPRFFIQKANAETDFAVMCLCEGGGVLSASSFSWWASYYSLGRSKSGIFIAPTFWYGHVNKKWLPVSIKTEWLSYKNV